ncbi:hypothetical protein [Lignipirellula cremea]|uniref:Uncharacterized protein n=1 Tax=Lignipirellula cremea TaxID=2528010 RepID=A0A518E4R2_9BACT|nr:hypothetical protein [Lignipirellula cremea]QDU99081.1 hypothetical protein Pla8534_69920 [Lignipirellula cremea]
MTVYSKVYCIASGPSQADCTVKFQIFVGNDPRHRLDVNYLDRSIIQLGAVRSVLPAQRDDPRSLLDACIAFYPQHFRDCPSLRAVEKQLRQVRELDFRLAGDTTDDWKRLRTEAVDAFKTLQIFEAPLRKMRLDGLLDSQSFSFRGAVRVAATWLRGSNALGVDPLPESRIALPPLPAAPDPHSRRSA